MYKDINCQRSFGGAFSVYRLLMKSEALCDIINFTISAIGFNSCEVDKAC